MTLIQVDKIKVGNRMRELDENKVDEIVASYESIGQINPISVDENYKLLAGHHRLAAAKKIGWLQIEIMLFKEKDLNDNLIEIDENLIRNELCYISASEHILERELILESLGKRSKRGVNRYTKGESEETTKELARRIGTSEKMYRLRRQVSEITPEARNLLRGTNYARKSLNDLIHLSKQKPDVQKRVGELAKQDPDQQLRFHIDTAKIELYTDREKSQLVAELKEKWGVPLSIKRFDREDHDLARICRQISKHSTTRVIKGDVVGREIPNYSGFVDHSLFLLEYFVRRPKSRILDNFMCKGTNLVAAMWMNMECHGFDLNPRNIDRTQDVLDQHFPNGTFHLYNEDGVDMKPLQNEEESFDAIITDPPYLNCPDLYTQEENDLSNMSQSQWEQMMAITFRHYHRLI